MPAPVVGWQGVPARIPKARAHFRYLLGKLAGRTPRPSQAALQPARGKSHDGRVVEAAKVRQAPRRLGGRPVLDLLPPVGSFRPREVLAVNLSAEGLAKVRDGSYAVVEQIALPEFGLTITRLRPPEDLNAVSAQGRLFDLLPDDGFTLNHVYTPYRPGAGPASVDASGSAPASKSCPAERCFGSTLISWRPSLATCARDIKVGIIDTGFDRAHPAFAGLRYEYREFLPEGRSSASAQHGTAVLSLLAGRADSGTPGLIPDASYVIANAFFADDGGQPVSDTAEMLKALHWLKRSGAAVVNLSFAGPEDELVHHAVQELTRAGAVVVAAAGNDGPSAPPSYPAAYPEVIAVTAVDRNLAAYRYASRGDHIDLAAPGVEVWTAMPGKREGAQTGTSFAVPYVTAVVAVALPEAGLAPDGDGLAAKRYALAQLHGNVRRLGGTGRNPTYGDGLVQAPQSCNPPPIAAVTASADPPVQAWAGTVHRAIEPAAAAEPVLIGSWVSTVRAASADSMAR